MAVSLRNISYADLLQSIRHSSNFELLVERVCSLFLKAIVSVYDQLFVPVHYYVKPISPYAWLAQDLFNTCTSERVENREFTAEDLTDVFNIQLEFFKEVARNFIGKVEGEQSKAYREEVWKSLKPKAFVETYLVANPNNLKIFRDVVLRSYL